MTHRDAIGRSRILVAAVVVASLAGAGCGAPGPDPSGTEVSTSAVPASTAPQTPGTSPGTSPGEATVGTAGNPGGGGPTEATTQPGPGEPAAETVWQPIHLLAPLRCFTEGLDARYVDGYGSIAVDPRPYGQLEFFEQEYDPLTRITMNSVDRRVILLPDRRVPAYSGQWLVDIVIRMHLSGGFVINYDATHRGETGSFTSPEFTSPVDDTCTVTILYSITTVPVA